MLGPWCSRQALIKTGFADVWLPQRPASASYYRARYYDQQAGRFLSEDPILFWGGKNFYRYVHNSATNFADPFGLTDYNEQQTLQKFLQPAYNDATAGYFQGLWNIAKHSKGKGDYDFGYNINTANDTFMRCGKKMTAAEFGNYMAGFETGAWDDAFYGHREIGFSLNHLYQLRYAEMTARMAGLVFHNLPGQTIAQNDRLDKTGSPWITLGADDGRSFSNRGGFCGCK